MGARSDAEYLENKSPWLLRLVRAGGQLDTWIMTVPAASRSHHHHHTGEPPNACGIQPHDGHPGAVALQWTRGGGKPPAGAGAPLNLQGAPSTEMEVVRGTSPFRLELELELDGWPVGSGLVAGSSACNILAPGGTGYISSRSLSTGPRPRRVSPVVERCLPPPPPGHLHTWPPVSLSYQLRCTELTPQQDDEKPPDHV
ncbi:hypothetical protein BKA56DRAFT_649646 [Ilyonectria sp. MPI-CAGE-AT-0026]|nr:hypothetical protein BKA56DRAFT_649646 [Ilyonectria sp. MPI-CAGE-AT-0026]